MPDAGGLSYPLALRGPGYSWLRAAVGLLALIASVTLVLPLALLPVAALVAWEQGGNFAQRFHSILEATPLTPGGLLVLNLSLAGIIPVSWLIALVLHDRPFRSLISVKPGFRWNLFAACLGLAFVVLVVQAIVSAFLPSDGDTLPGHPQPFGWTTVFFILVILVTTPLQAAGEEFAFRGYGMQAIGALTRSPHLAVVVTALFFALAHGVQNAPLFLDRLLFGLLAGYLVYRTGGLEAGIALHILTNFTAFGSALLTADISRIFSVHTASWWALLTTLLQSGLYLLLVLVVVRKLGLRTMTVPVLAPPEQSL